MEKSILKLLFKESNQLFENKQDYFRLITSCYPGLVKAPVENRARSRKDTGVTNNIMRELPTQSSEEPDQDLLLAHLLIRRRLPELLLCLSAGSEADGLQRFSRPVRQTAPAAWSL